MRTFRILAACTALLSAGACSDMTTPAAPEQAADPLSGQIEALGFRSDMVQDFGDFVLVEGDIYLTKEQLRSVRVPNRDPLSPRFQYRTTALVGTPKVYNILVDVSGLASQPGWQAAAREALTHWSGISDSYIRLVEGAPADITVATTCTSSNVAAYASWPSGGNPGSTIYVNTCFGYTTSHEQKVHNMVHEFGHTLGFRHSNYVQMGESAGAEGANHIWGTPTSGNASGSVMNGGTALYWWGGFAASDLTAARHLYPLPYVPMVWVTNSGGSPLISWNPAPGATSYTVELHAVYSDPNWTYGVYWGDSTTGTSLLDTNYSYTGVSECTYSWSWPEVSHYEYAVYAEHPKGRSWAFVVPAPVAGTYC